MASPQDAPAPEGTQPAPTPAPHEAAPTLGPAEAPQGEVAPAPAPAPPPAPVASELQPEPVTAADPSDPGLTSWLVPAGVGIALAVVGALVLRRVIAPPPLPGPTAPPVPTTDSAGDSVYRAPAPEPAPPSGLARFTAALSRTAGAFRDLFGRPIDESLLEDLEEALLVADVGMETTTRLLGRVRAAWKSGETGPEALRGVLRTEMGAILGGVHAPLVVGDKAPWVLLVVGVNGSGKTTTIGKLAARFTGEGKRVLLAAGDTYRAAAAEQLAVWAERSGADLVRHDEGADPGAVAYDALQAATARGHDVVIIDTAGRLQTRKPLMDQLSKVRRVIAKVVPDGPHETLLVIDGTMGQNALSQARLFHEATPLTGVAVTKLDGTAKGGVVLAVAAELGLPVKLVGVGEQVTDLRDFAPEVFVSAILDDA